ncbi:Thioredoxin-related protein [Tenacibaculum sp. 190130A14a]|uniref:Thioredoxin-related protein n=1 Tax=Tenacibaculum polynesiense TaxID=3137857 RepID=A0ABM9P7I5_9FLAO
MKKVVFLAFFVLATNMLYAQEEKGALEEKNIWSLSYKEALKKAKNEKKPLLVYFKGSDWCGPCKTLDKELFSAEKFINLSKKHFVLYEADIPMNQDLVEKERLASNKKLVKQFKVSSYPTILVLNHKQKVLGIKKGLILTEYYYPFFESYIK